MQELKDLHFCDWLQLDMKALGELQANEVTIFPLYFLHMPKGTSAFELSENTLISDKSLPEDKTAPKKQVGQNIH